MPELFRQKLICEVKSISDDNLKIRGVASTATLDRQGDVMIQSGWELDNVKSYLPLLLNHNYGSDPTALPIGKVTKTEIIDNKLVFEAELMPKDIDELSYKVAMMFKYGFLKAFSVGWSPKEWTDTENGRVYTKMELLEISVVGSIPANSEALIIAKNFFDPAYNEVQEKLVQAQKKTAVLKVYRDALKLLCKELSVESAGMNQEAETIQRVLDAIKNTTKTTTPKAVNQPKDLAITELLNEAEKAFDNYIKI